MARTLINAKSPIIPANFQRLLFKRLTLQGVCVESLLEGLNITKYQFHEDNFRFTFEQHIHFIKNALNVSKDPHLGWQLGRDVNVASLGILGYAVMSSHTYENAVNKLTHFLKLRAPSYELRLIEPSSFTESAHIEICESFDFGEIRYFMVSSIVSAFDNLFKALTQENYIISKVEFGCEQPDKWPPQSISIDYPITFGARSTKLYLVSGLLDKKLSSADPETERVTTQTCRQMLSLIENQSGIIGKLNAFLKEHEGNYPTLTETADYFNMSPRTLRRELERSNTSFQDIIDSSRFKIAKELLLGTSKTSTEIGFELGFKDASNFNRAFKKWAGVSPGKFRNQG